MYRLKTPFRLLISGPTQSGKSFFCKKLIENSDRIFDTKFFKIIWILGSENAKPKDLHVPVEYIIGLPSNFKNASGQPCLIILDDLMFEAQQNTNVANLFTKGSHHENLSIIFITQNLFQKGKYTRDISLNCNYFCLLKNPRDLSQFKHFARQILPDSSAELYNVYKRLTEKPFGYLFIDLNQTTNSLLRFLTDIFTENYLECYCTSNLPDSINDVPVNHEDCAEGKAYTTYFTEVEL